MEKLETPRKIVLDTSVLIDDLRKRSDRESLLARLEGASQLATTTISAFELYYGAYKSKDTSRNLASAKGLLSSLQVLDLTDQSCENAGRLLTDLEAGGNPIDLRDLLIGSIALTEGYAVLTKNRKDFARIRGLLVLEPKDIPP